MGVQAQEKKRMKSLLTRPSSLEMWFRAFETDHQP
jgi:hypothetical protein